MLLYSICALLLSQGVQYQTWILCKRLTSKENKTDKQRHWSIKQSEEFRVFFCFSAICKWLRIFPHPASSGFVSSLIIVTKFCTPQYSFIHPRWPWLIKKKKNRSFNRFLLRLLLGRSKSSGIELDPWSLYIIGDLVHKICDSYFIIYCLIIIFYC